MAMSLRELVERYTRGQSVPIHQPIYDSDSEYDLPDVTKLSTIERAEMIHDLKNGIMVKQEEMQLKKALREEEVKKLEAIEKANADELNKQTEEMSDEKKNKTAITSLDV